MPTRPSLAVLLRLLLLLALLVPSDVRAQDPEVDVESIRPELEAAIQAELDEGTASVSIALVAGDRIVWTAAYGQANVTTGTAATPATVYSTGSTGKSLTATAVMQLVERGEVELDAPANRYLGDPRIQDRLQADLSVTVRHLLSHISGLTCDVRTRPVFSRTLPPTLSEITGRSYSVRAPESEWEYCNAAYAIAGHLVEQVSGVEYEEYLVRNILEPLGAVTPAPVRPTAEMEELMARTYERSDDGRPVPVRRVFFDVYPAGDLYMTAEDMGRYLGAHLNGGTFAGGRILSAASVEEMRRPQAPELGRSYGLGFGVEEASDGHTIISHGGSVPGLNAHLIADVDARLGVYVMTNSGGHGEIARKALELLRGSPIETDGGGG